MPSSHCLSGWTEVWTPDDYISAVCPDMRSQQRKQQLATWHIAHHQQCNKQGIPHRGNVCYACVTQHGTIAKHLGQYTTHNTCRQFNSLWVRRLTGEDTSTAISSAASPRVVWYSSEKCWENTAISSNDGDPYSSTGYKHNQSNETSDCWSEPCCMHHILDEMLHNWPYRAVFGAAYVLGWPWVRTTPGLAYQTAATLAELPAKP